MKRSSLSVVTIVLIFIALALGAMFLRTLAVDLTTRNYNFFGTHYDFIAFYSGASSAWHHSVGQLYDVTKQIAFQRTIIPHPIGATGYMPFLDPPFLAVLMSPLAAVGISTARLVWLVLSFFMAVFCISVLTETMPLKQRWLAGGLLIVTFPMMQTFIEGQVSILVLLGACLGYRFFMKNKKFLSGVCLTLLWVIPQFGVFAALGLIVRKEWRVIKGWALTTALLLLSTLPFTGIKAYVSYLTRLTTVTGDHFKTVTGSAQLAWRGALNFSSSLNGFISALTGPGHTKFVNVLFGISVLTLFLLLYKLLPKNSERYSEQQNMLLFMIAVTSALLIDPHVFGQDVIIIYLILPIVLAVFRRLQLLAVVIFCIVTDLSYLDQYWRIHPFALVALLAIALAAKQIANKNDLPKTVQ